MNIDMNSNVKLHGNAWQVASMQDAAKPTESATPNRAKGLTVTKSVASPEDIAATEVSEDSLRRDDALGRLVSAAFDLPPPPMPAELAEH